MQALASLPEPLRNLISALGQLPGVGEQTAERLAFHLLHSEGAEALDLAGAIRAVKEKLRPCEQCLAATTEQRCDICRDPQRDPGLILVVETERELAAFERMGRYRGTYHVLGGRAALAEGKRYAAQSLERLRRRLATAREVIVGTNPDKHGDLACTAVSAALAGTTVTLTRLARGLPQGANIEWLGAPILEEALQERRAVGGAH